MLKSVHGMMPRTRFRELLVISEKGLVGAAWLRGGLARFCGFLVVLMRGYKQVFRAGFGGFGELLIWIWEGLGAWNGSFTAGWRRDVLVGFWQFLEQVWVLR